MKKDALPPATDNIPRGQRPNMYDTSLKVPTAVRWPGVTTPGTIIQSSVTQLDWFPTMVAIAEATVPSGTVVRGRNLAPLLRGNTTDWQNEVFTQYSTKHQSKTHMRCIRTPEWKLVRDFLNPERDELFNLKTDPEETSDVIDDNTNRSIVQKLHAKILNHMRVIGDSVPDTGFKRK
ncbi:MAG: sulfatase/phosphatase domain-containing protein [Fuerstiella sp.]